MSNIIRGQFPATSFRKVETVDKSISQKISIRKDNNEGDGLWERNF